MRIRNVENNQIAAWLFAGLSAPLAQIAGGMSWQTVSLAAAICLCACWLISRAEYGAVKWLRVIEYIWIVCLLGSMAAWISDSWVSGDVYPAVPLILLVLGGASAFRGEEKAARVGSILFWLIALVYAGVAAAGLGELDVRELSYTDKAFDARLIVVLLIPSLVVFWQRDGRRLPIRGVIGIFAFAALLPVLITGALSLQVAVSVESPLHEWVEGLSLAGTLQRFEAVVSAALTMGWFTLISFLICTAGGLASSGEGKAYGKGCWGAVAGAGLLVVLKKELAPEILMAGCLVLWVLAPAVSLLLHRNKI